MRVQGKQKQWCLITGLRMVKEQLLKRFTSNQLHRIYCTSIVVRLLTAKFVIPVKNNYRA